MTVQGIPQCTCHRHSQLIWRLTSNSVTEWLGLEETSGAHLVQRPAKEGSLRAGCTGPYLCRLFQLSREVSAQQGGGISPHFVELDPTSAASGLWRSQMTLMKNIMGSVTPVPTQHHSLYMTEMWEMLLKGRDDLYPSSSWIFTSLKSV